jgi:hypothetical protein
MFLEVAKIKGNSKKYIWIPFWPVAKFGSFLFGDDQLSTYLTKLANFRPENYDFYLYTGFFHGEKKAKFARF